MASTFICLAEDAWSWIPLLCGDHFGLLAAFWIA